MLYVTGDTHGRRERFSSNSIIDQTLTKGDRIIVCGDFGYLFECKDSEDEFLDFLATKPYEILWIDGNHENFDLINEYPEEVWYGGKIHVIRRDCDGQPKIVHLMRGQIYEIDGQNIFTFGGGYSMDRYLRINGETWWPEEMPTEEEMKEAVINLSKYKNCIDYIITHVAPEDTMNIFYPNHTGEKELNNFLEYIRENVVYKHWYFGHLHCDRDLWRNQTILWFQLRKLETNEIVEG